jgi:hypothetical protein
MKHPVFLSLTLALLLAGCHAAPSVRVPQAAVKNTRAVAVRTLPPEEAAPLAELQGQARAMLEAIMAEYHALGLDTASGRKLTPKNEPAVVAGLAPLVAQLDADMARIDERLASLPGEAAATLRAEMQRRPPLANDLPPPDASATDLLYRLALTRVKLGTLVEFTLRQDVVPAPPVPAVETPGF